MLIGFVACTSESELLDAPVNGDLVSITINLGSLQTKASVGLDTDEGKIENAVIGIFDTKGLPTIAPVILNGESGNMRIPLKPSNAYAFVNVSDEDIDALRAIGNAADFENYDLKKKLKQVARELPKYGSKLNFTPEEGKEFKIEVHQLTARLDVAVKIMEDGQDLTNTFPPDEFPFMASSVAWSNINDNGYGNVGNESGTFATTIGSSTYHVINRAYSYAGTNPTLALKGEMNGKDCNYGYTFALEDGLEADHVYVMLVTITVKKDIVISLEYAIIKAASIDVKVPDFD